MLIPLAREFMGTIQVKHCAGIGIVLAFTLSAAGCAKVKDGVQDLIKQRPGNGHESPPSAISPETEALPEGALTSYEDQRHEVLANLHDTLTLESELTEGQREKVIRDIYAFTQLSTHGSTATTFDPYEAAFHDSSLTAALGFVRERIKTVIAYRGDPADQSATVGTIASNLGASLFWLWKASPELVSATLNRYRLKGPGFPSGFYTDSRSGIVDLGLYARLPMVQRMKNLVHESRHSDCTGGISLGDLQKEREMNARLQQAQAAHDQGNEPLALELTTQAQAIGNSKQHIECGHLHAICGPESGDYAGHAACDHKAWGAYTMGAVFLNHLVNNCENCTETQHQNALMMFQDNAARLNTGWTSVADGSAGSPDLSSSTQEIP